MEGDSKIVIWDVANANVPGLPHKGELVLVNLNHKDVRDQRQSEYANIKAVIDAITHVKRESLSTEQTDKLFQVAKATPEQLERAYKILTDKSLYKDVSNLAFVMACLAGVDKGKLFTYPAGKSVHHTYQGGLIVHTAEVVQICRGVVAAFPFKHLINQDVVFAGATLHDIGKVFTYGLDEIGSPIHNVLESYVGHIYYGVQHLQKVGEERKVDEGFLHEVMHVVASHHTNPQFGAIKEPASLEAIIVSQADYLGSRAGMLESKLAPMKKNGTKLDEEWKAFDQRFIVGTAIKDWYSKGE
jgi:23S rRNA maturation-related 3'-5' exoribonuclease YhaM